MKKYDFTDEVVLVNGVKLHRIKALRDIPSIGIKAGDLGGFIERKRNLSHSGDCWVHEDAKVYGRAKVFENAQVFGHAKISDHAGIHGNARVFDYAKSLVVQTSTTTPGSMATPISLIKAGLGAMPRSMAMLGSLVMLEFATTPRPMVKLGSLDLSKSPAKTT